MSAFVPRLTQADCVMFAARPPQQSPANATCIYGILLHCNQMADMARPCMHMPDWPAAAAALDAHPQVVLYTSLIVVSD